MKIKRKRILIIAAHPDDEILGCGGSVAKWIRQGHNVSSLIMSEGSTSRDNKRNRKKRHKEISDLQIAAKKSAKILGVKLIKFFNFPDNRMDSVNLIDVVKLIEKQIKLLKPDTVVTHHHGDLNVDHKIVHEAVLTSCRPQKNNTVKRILSFEIPSSTEWTSPNKKTTFIPNHFEDISKTLKLKLRALKEYKMEMRVWPHPRSLKGVKYLANWRGSTIGCNSAEAFMLVRNIE